ncbi:ADP-ribosylglycohydrolase family protein [candidate division BRC1 bacterium HGW-BRC1-1]|jgi:ADP-ribosylglycohydrolase|nr:MAG: ADP-ribosylglycohydrolase family protein [candidate division BRC1 bacterium HGW-BRC1-1]
MDQLWQPPYVRFELLDVQTEWLQCEDEGRIIPPEVKAEFERLRDEGVETDANQEAFLRLLDVTWRLPVVEDFPYEEPSDLESIRAARPTPSDSGGEGEGLVKAIPASEDRIRGAWLGRSAGCLLGTPVEGWPGVCIEKMLRKTDRWPLRSYMRGDVIEAIEKEFNFNPLARWIDRVSHMPEDDDLNYTLIALQLLGEKGGDFSPLDVATHWLRFLPPWRTCTAERLAIRNFMLAIPPPRSAIYRNPYREWIGAQIRADMFGWVCPGRPELAAELAWRDASISHVGNGIYGEMWVAAMLAAAVSTDDPGEVIAAGLAQVPARSRLTEAVTRVVQMHADGAAYEDFVADHRNRWDAEKLHHWVHTISNAEIVAAALLWGAGNFGRTICLAVQTGMDTDCNGATAGSVVGLMLGAAALPAEWTEPLGGKVTFGVVGVDTVSFDQLVADTMIAIKKVGKL